MSELLIWKFFDFVTEPCPFCVTIVAFLKIMTNHCARYIIIFEQRLVILVCLRFMLDGMSKMSCTGFRLCVVFPT